MNNSIVNFDTEVACENHGKMIYETNPMFKDVLDFMEDSGGRQFYNKYMKNPYDRDSMMYFLWLYDQIDSSSDINAMKKLAILHKCASKASITHELFKRYTESPTYSMKTKKLTRYKHGDN